MMDWTQENLRRIRACDEDWDESKHPRANNGQFSSGGGGGGAKKSKPAKSVSSGGAKGGNLKKINYNPPSYLKGCEVVLASKKHKSGLGTSDRYHFGFTKYKDSLMVRYEDSYSDDTNYAFIPLKDLDIEKIYSYSDVAAKRLKSALNDAFVNNNDLKKVVKQMY